MTCMYRVERRTGVPIDTPWQYIDRPYPPNTFRTTGRLPRLFRSVVLVINSTYVVHICDKMPEYFPIVIEVRASAAAVPSLDVYVLTKALMMNDAKIA